MQVALENVQVLNPLSRSLPFSVTTSDEVKDMVTEEIRLRYQTVANETTVPPVSTVVVYQKITNNWIFFLFSILFWAFVKPQVTLVSVLILAWHRSCLLFFSSCFFFRVEDNGLKNLCSGFVC